MMKEKKKWSSSFKILPILCISVTFIFSACDKKEFTMVEDAEPEEQYYTMQTPTGEFTILGNERPIPFTVDNMNDAYNVVYSTTSANLEITHNYVKFTPQTNQEYVMLVQSDLDIEDFPLNYEIIQMGEKYVDPAVSANAIPPLYGVIEKGRQLPTQNFELLADLHLYSSDEAVIRKAIELIGFNPDSTGYAIPGPNWTGPDDDPPGPPTGNPGPLIRAANCSCKNGGEQRNPAGCITLEDTQLTPGQCGIGVRGVKVIVKDRWLFSRHTTYTNEGGCFRFWNLKFKGNAWMKVKFKNSQVKVRALKGNFFADIFSNSTSVKDGFHKYSGPNFRNMDRCYTYVNDFESNDHRIWRTATIFNSVREFHDWTINEGFPTGIYRAPSDLIFLTTSRDNSGAAPMLNKIYQVEGPLLPLHNQLNWEVFGIPVYQVEFGLPIGTFVSIFTPDIVINRRTEAAMSSDRIKYVCYHELAHAQHFHRLGANRYNYWVDNLFYIIAYGAYGDGTGSGAGQIQVVEMWGHHVGSVITEEAYGEDHSWGGAGQLLQANRWQHRLEATTIEELHLPTGLLLDIFDDNLPNDQFEHPDIVGFDNVTGYDHKLFLQEMDATVTSPQQFIDNFRTNQVSTGDLQVYNTLMSRYGY